MLTEKNQNLNNLLNLFQNFKKWSKIHYFAFKMRKSFPNLFFHYFNSDGIVDETFSKEDVNEVLTTMRKFNKDMNGLWGYLSVILKNKNGICVYKMINSSAFYNHSYSVGCIQDGDISFSKDIKAKVDLIFSTKENIYAKIEEDFEDFLIKSENEKEFKIFLEQYKNKPIFTISKNATLNLLRNENEYIFQRKKENSNPIYSSSTHSKKRKIISDDMDVDSSNKHKNFVKSFNNVLLQNNTEEKFMTLKCFNDSKRERLIKFLFNNNDDSNSSSLEETSVNETIQNNQIKEFTPNYILFKQSNDCISDDGKKIFKNEKKNYESDGEEYNNNSKENSNNKRVLIFKSSKNLNKIEENINTFQMNNIEIKKLKRELLNKKTKREKTKINKIIRKDNNFYMNNNSNTNIGKIKSKRNNFNNDNNNFNNNNFNNNLNNINLNNFYQNNEYINSSKKRKLNNNSMSNNITEKVNSFSKNKKSLNNINNNINNILLDDNKSTISNISNISNSGKKRKEINNSIKNFFSTNYDKNNPLLINTKIENKNKFIKSNTNSIHNSNTDSINNYKTKIPTILSYFPQQSNVNKKREGEIIKNICKLINNSKYQELINLLEKDPQMEYSRTISKVSFLHSELMNKANDIDSTLIDSITIGELNFEYENKKFDFKNKNDTQNSFKNLLIFYKENLNTFLSFISESNNNEDIMIILKNLKFSENLLKEILKNKNEIELLTINLKNEINEIFLLFLSKLFNCEDDQNAELIIERLVVFVIILRVIYSNFNLISLKESSLNFIKMTVYIILIKLYNFNMRNLKEKEELLIYISLLSILKEVFATFSGNKNISSFNLLKIIFKEYLCIENTNLDLQTSEIKNNFQDTIQKIFKGNFFDHSTFEKTMKMTLYKIFIMQTNRISNLNELSESGKKLIFNPIFIQLYQRYFNLFFLMFIENHKSDLEFFEHLDEFYNNTINSQNSSYYDIDSILKQVDSIEIKRIIQLETKENLLRKYLISDSDSILIFDQKYKIDSTLKLKILFKLINSISTNPRKNIIAEDEINKKNLYQLLDKIFNDDKSSNEENNFLTEFLLNICKIVRNILTKNETDDKTRKKILSIFISLLTNHKNIFEIAQMANQYENKLGIIPIFAIVLSLIEFTIISDKIEFCVQKICDILDFNKTSHLLKGFNIAILMRIIIKFSKEKIDIKKFVHLVNNNVKSVIDLFEKMDKLPNLENNDKIKEEHSRTLEYYLKVFIKISNEDPNLIVYNSQILEEMNNIIKCENMNKTLKRMVFVIIENILNKFDNLVEENIKKNENILIEVEGLEIGFDELFDMEENLMENNQIYDPDAIQKEFLNCLKNNFISIMNCMILSFFTQNNSINSNIHSRQKISIELLQKICEVYPKIYAILVKYNMIKMTEFIKHFSTNSQFFSNIQIHKENQEWITFIPFKAFNIFMNFNKLYINDLILRRDYKPLQHFIKFFFFGSFYTFNRISNKNQYGMKMIKNFNNENVNFLTTFYNMIDRNLIENNLSILRNENESDKNREESSYYNILLFFIDNFNFIENNNLFQNMKNLETFFFNLFEQVSLLKNVNKIETRFLFDLLLGLDEIISRNILFDSINKFIYAETVRNIFMKILNKFKHEFFLSKLDQNSENFLRKFIKFSFVENFNLGMENFCHENLVFNSDFKEIIFSLINLNKAEKNKEIVTVYVNEYMKLLNDKILLFLNENIVDSEFFGDFEFNLVFLESMSYNNHLNLNEFYFIINSILDNLLKLEDLNLFGIVIEKLIKIVYMNLDKNKNNFRTDLSINLFNLILEKIYVYFDMVEELDNIEKKETEFRKYFIDDLFAIICLETIHLSFINNNCNNNFNSSNRIDILKNRNNKILVNTIGADHNMNNNEIESNLNSQITRVDLVNESFYIIDKFTKIFKEFYINENKEEYCKYETVLMIQQILKETSQIINNTNKIERINTNLIEEYF